MGFIDSIKAKLKRKQADFKPTLREQGEKLQKGIKKGIERRTKSKNLPDLIFGPKVPSQEKLTNLISNIAKQRQEAYTLLTSASEGTKKTIQELSEKYGTMNTLQEKLSSAPMKKNQTELSIRDLGKEIDTLKNTLENQIEKETTLLGNVNRLSTALERAITKWNDNFDQKIYYQESVIPNLKTVIEPEKTKAEKFKNDVQLQGGDIESVKNTKELYFRGISDLARKHEINLLNLLTLYGKLTIPADTTDKAEFHSLSELGLKPKNETIQKLPPISTEGKKADIANKAADPGISKKVFNVCVQTINQGALKDKIQLNDNKLTHTNFTMTKIASGVTFDFNKNADPADKALDILGMAKQLHADNSNIKIRDADDATLKALLTQLHDDDNEYKMSMFEGLTKNKINQLFDSSSTIASDLNTWLTSGEKSALTKQSTLDTDFTNETYVDLLTDEDNMKGSDSPKP